MILTYKKNIIFSFLKNILIINILFFSLIIILNILEEITFFKDVNVSFITPLYLTLLNSFSILFEIFPFIFLIGGMFFFIETLEKNELIIYKSNGISNLRLICIITGTTFFFGIFLILIFYNISSNLKFLYLEKKTNYTQDGKYLAVVTANGLWIKDHSEGSINIINADNMTNNNLNQVIISQFDSDYNFLRMIDVNKINIQSKIWLVKNPRITENNLTVNSEENLLLKTNFDAERISTLFSNLTSLNLIKLNKLKKDYASLGYSTVGVKSHLLNIYLYPVYLSIMICIASILMLNIGHNKPKIFFIIAGILISVIVYYINYLFNVLIENNKIPSMFSVWFPHFLLFLICLVGLVRINEK